MLQYQSQTISATRQAFFTTILSLKHWIVLTVLVFLMVSNPQDPKYYLKCMIFSNVHAPKLEC